MPNPVGASGHRALTCVVYTRKSSEEGLEQSFNSLDAQREACEAYIQSQRHEGWKISRERYDDGGYSGGSMDRPALQRLLFDINDRKVDVVVVYKVDRLTRSLVDFAKIIEVFDTAKASFVSVTQQFNTTTSMGRLTLNVLLSFAQFEREVTGERIRDKIAASKKKGMWMGGPIPLGYDLKDRKLLVNEKEAELVRTMYRRYLVHGQVRSLQAELKAKGVRSKRRTSRTGKTSGGVPYSRGALYAILRNRLYTGEIPHRAVSYPGTHEAIVPRDLWDQVQARLTANRKATQAGLKANAPSLLAGLLFDAQGNRFTPAHTSKSCKRYRYYVSQAVIRKRLWQSAEPERLPAQEIEALVLRRVGVLLASPRDLLETVSPCMKGHTALQKEFLTSAKTLATRWAQLSASELRAFLQSCVSRVVLSNEAVEIHIARSGLAQSLEARDGHDEDKAQVGCEPRPTDGSRHDNCVLHVPVGLKRCGAELRAVLSPGDASFATPSPSAPLIKAIARALRWYEMLISGEIPSIHAIAKSAGLNERYVSRVLRSAFLSPDIVEELLNGTQSADISLDKLMRGIPIGWHQQRKAFASSRPAWQTT